MPTAFIAGATGYTGKAMLEELARATGGWTARPHARSAGKLEGAVVCDPRDVAKLTEGMRGCDAVVQLIGTVRAKFAEGDYEAIDYGTTVALGEAARAAGVPRLLLLSSVGAASARGKYLQVKRKTEGDYEAIDYGTTVALGEAARAAGVPRLLLLSSVGAASARGKYLQVKRKTEEWVEKSGLEYTIVRPSFIVGPGRRAAQIFGAFAYPLPAFRAIEVHELARVFIRALERREAVKNRILEGKSMWQLLG